MVCQDVCVHIDADVFAVTQQMQDNLNISRKSGLATRIQLHCPDERTVYRM